MIIPGKLSIVNYCQISKLSLDISSANVFAITGTNGAGKSNALNALRFALSGLSSPGADKLSEDVRDEADKAIVELEFTIDETGTGHIKREIFKAGGANCTLTINLEGHPKEVITKSLQAEKRFFELLGVSPKHISEIVIADQHSIEALLFWPASERGPKFQRFLHGQMFQEVEKLVQKEKKLILLDPRAQERKESLEKSLLGPAEDKKVSEKEITRIEKFLNKEEVIKVQEKARKVEQFSNLKNELKILETAKSEQELLGQERSKAIQLFPDTLEKNTEAIKKEIQILEHQWNEYRPYITAQTLLAGLTLRKDKLDTRLFELQTHINREELEKTELELLKQAKAHWEITQIIATLQEQISSTEQFIETATAKAKLHIAHLQTLEQDLKDEPTYHLLDEVIKHLESHTAKDCVVCGGNISDSKIKTLQVTHKALGNKLVLVKQNIEKENQAKISLEKEIYNTSRNLEHLKSNMAEANNILLTHLPTETPWKDSLLTRVKHLEAELGLLPARKDEEQTIVNEKADITNNIIELSKIKKIKPPKENEQTLISQKQELVKLETSLTKLIEMRREADTNSGRVLQLTAQIKAKETQFKENGLPDSSKEWQLTTTEAKVISDCLVEKEKLIIERETLAGATGSIKSISTQVRKAELEVAGFEETKAYASDLDQIEAWFKYNGIPSQILRQQLNALCTKMESIIRRFQIKQTFKLSVDANLEIHMVYPSGAIRPITKASGGERIILGIAFRLATHSCLSPELPLLALDEPSNHLVDANQTILQELIRSLKNNLQDYGLRKFIYCTHSKALANEAEKIIDLS